MQLEARAKSAALKHKIESSKSTHALEMQATQLAMVIEQSKIQAIKVTLAGLNGAAPVKCSRDVVLLPDAALADVAEEKYDLIVVPGGNSTSVKQLAESSLVGKMLKSQDESSLLIGAICAGPKSFIPTRLGWGK
ncbi:PARK7 [Bugula neritina]|uniref:PARK7 n=1 Tax=Bugula neritina TaxID=10212 RepID=A0A7J7K7A6_BUGNE|nr:PARK7 [Bugula neritina]